MPTQITYNGVTTTLTYDGEGNRVKKVKGAETVIYVGDIYEVRNGTATSYIYANGRLVTTISGTTEYYTHADHLGSTSLTTDESGVPVEEIGYLPFGAVLFRNVYNGGTWELLSNVVFEESGGVPHFLYSIDKFYTLNDLP